MPATSSLQPSKKPNEGLHVNASAPRHQITLRLSGVSSAPLPFEISEGQPGKHTASACKPATAPPPPHHPRQRTPMLVTPGGLHHPPPRHSHARGRLPVPRHPPRRSPHLHHPR